MDEQWMTSGEGHPRRWRILAVLVVSLLMVVLDNSVLNIALPTIQRDLNTTQSELVWAVDAYILSFAALLFTWGVLGDRIGRKRVLLGGMTLFGLASFAASFSTTPAMLIALRTIMGVGGAAVMPTTLAVITVVFPPHERGKAIGMWAGSVGAAITLGPVLGGLLLEHPEWSNWFTGNDWGSVFLINLPIVIVGLIGITRVVPETRNPHAGRLDLSGLAISILGLVSLVYGIIHASQTLSWTDASVVLPILGGVLVLALFVYLEARSDHSSFDVSLFRNRGYAVSLSAVSLAFFAMSGVTFTLPFYLQIVRGYSTLMAGLMFLPFAVGQLLAAPRAAGMVLRFGYRRVMGFGLVLVSISTASLLRLTVDLPIWQVLTAFFFYGFGMGNVMAPGSTVMQNVLPLARAGAGSAVQNTVRQVASALGIAIIGTLLSTQYAAGMRSVFDGLTAMPQAARDAASKSLMATVGVLQAAVAQGAPAAPLDAVRERAFQAFVDASHVTLLFSLGALLLAAFAVIALLPHIEPPRKGAHGRPAGPHGASDADALVQREMASYADEAAQEYRHDTD